MDNDEIVKAIAEIRQRSKSNSRRIDELEENAQLLHKMVTALEVLATQQRNVAEHVEKIDGKVTRLEQAPIRRISSLVGYLLAAICSAVVGTLFGIYI